MILYYMGKRAKEKLYTIAEELIKTRGPCSIYELSDYIISKNGNNVKWLPPRGTISTWMRVNSAFYVDIKNLWHIK